MNKLNAKNIRNDFPILSRSMAGKPLIYLDSAATTQKPSSVIDAISNFYKRSNANIHRGVYPLAEEATALFENTRARVAKFIVSETSDNIIFTRNTTESINLVAHSWARKHLKAGDEILVTQLEHHANFVPWYLLAKEKGIKLSSAPITKSGELDIAAFKSLLNKNVKLVCVSAMSNVLGTIVPVKEIAALAHKNGSLVLVDAAQSAPHMPTHVGDMECDFLAFSAHKMLGPTGVGVLWVRRELLDNMDPFMGGGEMINTVSIEKTTWAEPPYKFEAGTPNYADVAAFSAALDYLENIGMDAIRQHEKELTQYALKRLAERPDISVYGPLDPEKRGGAISFNHKIVHAHDVGTILGEEGIAIRVGHHCAQPLMKALGVPATARASFYIYTTTDDIEALMTGLNRVDQVFGLVKK